MLDSDVFQRSTSDVIYFITSTAKKTSDLERNTRQINCLYEIRNKQSSTFSLEFIFMVGNARLFESNKILGL